MNKAIILQSMALIFLLVSAYWFYHYFTSIEDNFSLLSAIAPLLIAITVLIFSIRKSISKK